MTNDPDVHHLVQRVLGQHPEIGKEFVTQVAQEVYAGTTKVSWPFNEPSGAQVAELALKRQQEAAHQAKRTRRQLRAVPKVA